MVFHIVYQNQEQNISDRKVLSQLDVINRDFNLRNADTILIPSIYNSLKSKINVQFVLARTDPQGKASPGIVRVLTSKPSFTFDDRVKLNIEGGSDAWPADKYLNVWVCNMQSPVLGYSSFPGENPLFDGVVIDYQAFGKVDDRFATFNLGRTLTHELGHYFNLYHIWGDEPGCTASDSILDTPVQNNFSTGCPEHPRISCGNNGDLYVNYMDYTDDRCMAMFTEGQRQRMIQTLSTFRSTLGTHGLDQLPVIPGLAAVISEVRQSGEFECSRLNFSIQLENIGTDTIYSVELKLDSQLLDVQSFPPMFPRTQIDLKASLSFLQKGKFFKSLLVHRLNNVLVQDTIPFKVFFSSSGDTAALSSNISSEDFESKESMSWVVIDRDTLDDVSFSLSDLSGFLDGNHSLQIRADGSPIQTYGQSDEIVSPFLGLLDSTASISFDYAYLQYSGTSNTDTLVVEYSIDCGKNYQQLSRLFGPAFRTAQRSNTMALNASRRSDWRNFVKSISEKTKAVSFRLRFINNGGGNLWIDNIKIVPSSESLRSLNFSVYPNPVKDVISINSSEELLSPPLISIFTVSGTKLAQLQEPVERSSDLWTYRLPQLSSQLLILKIEANGTVKYTKVMVTP